MPTIGTEQCVECGSRQALGFGQRTGYDCRTAIDCKANCGRLLVRLFDATEDRRQKVLLRNNGRQSLPPKHRKFWSPA
jgi:hypothetical protein